MYNTHIDVRVCNKKCFYNYLFLIMNISWFMKYLATFKLLFFVCKTCVVFESLWPSTVCILAQSCLFCVESGPPHLQLFTVRSCLVLIHQRTLALNAVIFSLADALQRNFGSRIIAVYKHFLSRKIQLLFMWKSESFLSKKAISLVPWLEIEL